MTSEPQCLSTEWMPTSASGTEKRVTLPWDAWGPQGEIGLEPELEFRVALEWRQTNQCGWAVRKEHRWCVQGTVTSSLFFFFHHFVFRGPFTYITSGNDCCPSRAQLSPETDGLQ